MKLFNITKVGLMNWIKKKMISLFPNKLVAFIRFIKTLPQSSINYWYDFYRYSKYNFSWGYVEDFKKIEAVLFMRAHVIEKGMTLKKIRLGYGQAKINTLLVDLDNYVKYGYSTEEKCFKNIIAVLCQYIKFNAVNGCNVDNLKKKLHSYLTDFNDDPSRYAGVVSFNRSQIEKKAQLDFPDFFNSRYSLRNFSNEEVDINQIINAIKLAQKAPSACNRQPGKVYIITSDEIKKEIIRLHPGTNGFGEIANKFLVITSDLRCYGGVGERNQVFIDGALFAMSIINALHYYSIGCCALHWGGIIKQDKELRKYVRMNLAETVIMLLAVGSYPETFNVAKSCKRDIGAIYTVV
jgi:nitroreductase